MAYKVIILYRLYMPSYFLGTFTEYPSDRNLPCSNTTNILIYNEKTKSGKLYFSY